MPTMFDMLLAQRGLGDGRVMPISGVPTAPMTVGGGPIAPRPPMAPMGSGVPEDPIAKARSMLSTAMGGARQGVDPRIEARFARREAQRAKQESEIRESPSLAETLVRIGTAMAKTRSRTFSGGLAEGLEANMQANLAQRAEAMRQRQAIAEGRDEDALERIRQEGAGRKEAMDELNVVLNLAKNIGGIEGDALDRQAKQIAATNAPAEATAKLRKIVAEATTAEVDAKYAPRVAEADIAAKVAAAASSRRGGDGDGQPTRAQAAMDRQVYDTIDEYTKAMGEYESLRQDPDALPSQVQEARQRVIALKGRADAFRRAYQNQFGKDPALIIPNKGMFAPKTVVRPGAANLQDPLGIRG